jgi:hypothetical protein
MRELQNLKKVLNAAGSLSATEWTPSAANRFAHAFSRRLPIDDIRIREQFMHSVADGIAVPISRFPNKRTIGEHPVYARKRALEELSSHWFREEVPMLCPPVDLIATTVQKLRVFKAPAILMIPNWRGQPWFIETMQIADRSSVLEISSQEAWDGARRRTHDQPSSESPLSRSEYPRPGLSEATARGALDHTVKFKCMVFRLSTCIVNVAPEVWGSCTEPENGVVVTDVRTGLLQSFPDVCKPGARRVRALVEGYAWNPRTIQTRGSQWRCYVEFCERDGRNVMPLTEANLLAFIGWLSDEKDAGRRAVSPASLAQYLRNTRHPPHNDFHFPGQYADGISRRESIRALV